MTARTPERTDQLIDRWRASIDATSARARELTAGLSPAQMSQKPALGGWSIGQVFEHLVLTGEMYLVGMDSAIENARPATREVVWRPTWIGGLIAGAISPQSVRRVAAPKRMQPGPTARPDVVAAFLTEKQRIRSLLERSVSLDLNRVKIASPIARIIRLNLGDCFEINVQHSARHLEQVARVRREVVG
jgi:hypothetical protein